MDIQNTEDIRAAFFEIGVLKLAYALGDFLPKEIATILSSPRQPNSTRVDVTPDKIEAWLTEHSHLFETKTERSQQVWQIRYEQIDYVKERINELDGILLPIIREEVQQAHPNGLHEDGKDVLDLAIFNLSAAVVMARTNLDSYREEIIELAVDALPWAKAAELGCKRAEERFGLSRSPEYTAMWGIYRASIAELAERIDGFENIVAERTQPKAPQVAAAKEARAD